MATTKAQILNRAFDAIRISGLTVMATPSQIAQALVNMETAMSEMKYGRNWEIGYNFEDVPNINSQVGVPLQLQNAVVYITAMRTAIQYGKDLPVALVRAATAATSAAQNIVSRGNLNPIQPSRRMPVGNGNTWRTPYFSAYSLQDPLPPALPDLQTITIGEVKDFSEPFAAWLGTNTITTLVIDIDPGFILDSSSFSGSTVSYRLTAQPAPATGVWRYVKITVTDNTGRIEIRLVNFRVIDLPEVPSA